MFACRRRTRLLCEAWPVLHAARILSALRLSVWQAAAKLIGDGNPEGISPRPVIDTDASSGLKELLGITSPPGDTKTEAPSTHLDSKVERHWGTPSYGARTIWDPMTRVAF